ncbi:MAG TPA: GAF domain-containing protein [Actinomycetota bacterium]|nr:GAF domain-containing protein [Actinomycetota bacterium]
MRIQLDPRNLLSTFLDTTLQLTGDLDVEHVLLAIVERSMELTGAQYGAAVTVSPEGAIESFQYRGLTDEQVALLPHLPEGKGLLGLIIDERKTVRIGSLQDHPASVGFPDHHVPMHAFLGVPLQSRGQLVGALYLTKTPDEPPFDADDETFFETMAAIAAVGITNARLYSAEKQRSERSALMSEISSKVRHSLDIDEVLSATVETLGRAAKVDRAFIHLVTEAGGIGLGEIRAEWDSTGTPSLKTDERVRFPISEMVMRTRQVQWTDDVMEDERLAESARPNIRIELVQHGTRAVLAAPLEWGNELLGVVAFHSRTPRKWAEGEIALIEAAAREVSIALNHARRFSQAVETAERLRHLDEMRSDFVAMVSHELRSPMTVVAGIADILKKRQSALSAEQRDELIETLGREARRLTRLVSEVLDLEAIDQDGMELQLSRVDLAALAREAVTDAGAADRTELKVGRGDAVCVADGDRVKQVLLNLISNAVKFSGDDKAISVTVAPERNGVCVSVTDEGPGISDADKKRLFQRFTRLSTGPDRKPGSGLGLYLSHSIVDAHDGEIWVDSEPGAGATFSFRLPRTQA